MVAKIKINFTDRHHFIVISKLLSPIEVGHRDTKLYDTIPLNNETSAKNAVSKVSLA